MSSTKRKDLLAAVAMQLQEARRERAKAGKGTRKASRRRGK